MRVSACRTFLVAVLTVPAALSLSARTVGADPLIVTGGFVGMHWDGSTNPFDLIGDGFRLQGGDAGTAPETHLFPGDVFDMSTRVSPGGLGPATAGDFSGAVWYAGDLRFTAVPLIVPDTDEPFLNLSTRFTMTGEVLGFDNQNRAGEPLFMVAVAGSGTGFWGPARNLGAEFGSELGYILNSGGARFVFEAPSAPAPIPEPASMVLLGSGLAGLAARRGLRRKTGRQEQDGQTNK